jgi:hypothetical protein
LLFSPEEDLEENTRILRQIWGPERLIVTEAVYIRMTTPYINIQDTGMRIILQLWNNN